MVNIIMYYDVNSNAQDWLTTQSKTAAYGNCVVANFNGLKSWIFLLWLLLFKKKSSKQKFCNWHSLHLFMALTHLPLACRQQYLASCAGQWRRSWWSPLTAAGSLCSSWREPSTSLLPWFTTHRALQDLSYDTSDEHCLAEFLYIIYI